MFVGSISITEIDPFYVPERIGSKMAGTNPGDNLSEII